MLKSTHPLRHRVGKAILIGIKGPGTNGQLKEIPGVYEDVERFQKFLSEFIIDLELPTRD